MWVTKAKVSVALSIIVTLWSVVPNAHTAPRCSDLFNTVADRVASLSPYSRDFGAGAFIERVGPNEFIGNPPPTHLVSQSAMNQFVLDLAKTDQKQQFTVLFRNMSESEVVACRAVLEKDVRVAADERLTSILINETPDEAKVATGGYDRIRGKALKIRESLLKRYDWRQATVAPEVPSSNGESIESYRLTIPVNENAESFLLNLYGKAKQAAADRAAVISSHLQQSDLSNATPEQLSRYILRELRASDPGITGSSLRVLAADFVIAKLNAH